MVGGVRRGVRRRSFARGGLMQHFRGQEGSEGRPIRARLSRSSCITQPDGELSLYLAINTAHTLILQRPGRPRPPNRSRFHAYVRSITADAACNRHARLFATAPCRPIYRSSRVPNERFPLTACTRSQCARSMHDAVPRRVGVQLFHQRAFTAFTAPLSTPRSIVTSQLPSITGPREKVDQLLTPIVYPDPHPPANQ